MADLADIRSDDAVLSINFVPYSRDIRLIAAAVGRSGAALISIADSRVDPTFAIREVDSSVRGRESLVFSIDYFGGGPGGSVAAAMLAHAGDGAVSRVRAVEKALYSSGSYEDHA